MTPGAGAPGALVVARVLQLDPHGPVVRNPSDARHAPTRHAQTRPARKNPVVMLTVKPRAPSARAGRHRRRKAVRFERAACCLARDWRESVEVAEHDRGLDGTIREAEHGVVLLQLTYDARVRVYVYVEDPERRVAEGDCRGEPETRTPWAFLPGECDALGLLQRRAAQNRDARVARLAHAHALLEVEPPLSVFGLNVRRRVDVRARVLDSQSLCQLARDVTASRANRPAVCLLQ